MRMDLFDVVGCFEAGVSPETLDERDNDRLATVQEDYQSCTDMWWVDFDEYVREVKLPLNVG